MDSRNDYDFPLAAAVIDLEDLTPENAWDADWHLRGIMQALNSFGQFLTAYGETLNDIGIDPNVSTILTRCVPHLDAAFTEAKRASKLYSGMYAPLMQSTESWVRVPANPAFFKRS